MVKLIDHTAGNFGERQTSVSKDWGYYAHMSIYDFATKFITGKEVLDVGCGTGHGAAHLAKNRLCHVRGLERDADLVAELRNSFPNVSFDQCDLDNGTLPCSDQSINLVFTSNVLEHVAYVDPVLREFSRILTLDGIAIIAIPPIPSVHSLKENAKNMFHISNLPHAVWESKLLRFFDSVVPIRHWVIPERSKSGNTICKEMISSVSEFTFEQCRDLDDVKHTITAIYVCRKPRSIPGGEESEAKVPAVWRHLRVEAEGRQEVFIELHQQLESRDDHWRKVIGEILDWVAKQPHSQTADNILPPVIRHLKMIAGKV